MGLLTKGKIVGEAFQRMEYQVHTTTKWARQHTSVFDPAKLQLIHFINPQKAAETRHKDKPLILESVTPHPQEVVKYLGVWIDKDLTFNKHQKQMVAKANGTLGALIRIAKYTWGTSLEGLQ
jgi:hypothetical protein